LLLLRRPSRSPLFPYTTLFRSLTKRKKIVPPEVVSFMRLPGLGPKTAARIWRELGVSTVDELKRAAEAEQLRTLSGLGAKTEERSEEHTSELQSLAYLVCRLLL